MYIYVLMVADMLDRPRPVVADEPGDACGAKVSLECRDTNESGCDCSILRLLTRWKPLTAHLPPRRLQSTAPLFQQLHLGAAAFQWHQHLAAMEGRLLPLTQLLFHRAHQAKVHPLVTGIQLSSRYRCHVSTSCTAFQLSSQEFCALNVLQSVHES